MASTGVCSPAPNWRQRLGATGAQSWGHWRREQFRVAIKFFRASFAVRRALAGIILGSIFILSAINTQLHTELLRCLKGSLNRLRVFRTAGRPLVVARQLSKYY
jgi:hypothetical protein